MTAPVLSVPALQIRLDPQGVSTHAVTALLQVAGGGKVGENLLTAVGCCRFGNAGEARKAAGPAGQRRSAPRLARWWPRICRGVQEPMEPPERPIGPPILTDN